MNRDPMRPFDDREFLNKIDQNPEPVLRDVKYQVSDIAPKAKGKAGQVADAVSEQLGQQRENAADALGRVASTMHKKAGKVPGGIKVVHLTHSIANGVGSTASYLRDHDFTQMGKDVMNICRSYPTQSFVAALAVGFLLGHAARRK
jgi:hypothetical protein